jgi:hypothetical protein
MKNVLVELVFVDVEGVSQRLGCILMEKAHLI